MDDSLQKIKALYPEDMDAEPKSTGFGERLRQIRKELGESQDEFAARIGTSKQVLSRYEIGQRVSKISFTNTATVPRPAETTTGSSSSSCLPMRQSISSTR